MNTDDLRESPNVELAERLIGKGFDVRIYDPVVNPARLVGANRRYVESKLPHLGRLLAARRRRGAATGPTWPSVSATDSRGRRRCSRRRRRHLIDLTGRLGAEVEALPGYEGVGW